MVRLKCCCIAPIENDGLRRIWDLNAELWLPKLLFPSHQITICSLQLERCYKVGFGKISTRFLCWVDYKNP